MTFQIPQKTSDELFDAYNSLADQAYELFGVECDVIYLPKKQSVPQSTQNNIPEFNSINARRKRLPDVYDRQNNTFTEVENSEKIKLRIYWNAKDWQTIYGYTTVPDNDVMFLAKLEDSIKLNQAVKVRFTDNVNNVYIFSRKSECIPYAFRKDRYCSSIWTQEQ